MDKCGDARMRNLLRISTDLRKQMDEVRKLRKTLRSAESKKHDKRRIEIGGVRDREFRLWS